MENIIKPKMLASEAANIMGVTVQAVHQKIKANKLRYSKMRNRVFFEHETAIDFFKNYKSSCKVVVFVLVKGGVGKTTICRETAIRATLMGKKVLAIEIDHQGNLSKSFGIKAHETPVLIDLLDNTNIAIEDAIVPVLPGLDILPSRYDNSILDTFIMVKTIPLNKVLKEKVESLRIKYDLILIDCPPSLGQAVSAAAICADLIVLPTTPCDFSDSGIDITVNEIKRIAKNYDANISMKVVLNQYDNRESDSYETLSELIKHKQYGKMLFNCYIRKCKEIEKLRRRHSTVFETTVSTFGREDIDNFTRELLGMDQKHLTASVAENISEE